MAAPFVVGIDLGTTNSCLAWTAGGSPIRILPIEQLTPEGRATLPVLPSVLYAPIPEERAPGEADRFANPYADAPWITGELARVRGAEVTSRSITSAKSWLSHPALDPDEPFLPRGALAGAPRLSPTDASARILMHLARVFESHTRRRLADATVVLTLPASFDDSARAATLEAARRAGLRVSLLEEPQAAFYDFMGKEGALAALLGKKVDALVLVVDVGGGTTDLSLMLVERRGRDVACKRIATGDHLLLGGDNMDLALAALVRARLDTELDAYRAGQLLRQCRSAKEALLAEGAPESFPIALAGRGSKLVGGTLSAQLGLRETRRAIMEGFFPKAQPGRLPPFRRAALVAQGLPYARDPAITTHIARFLERYADGRAPNAVLLNGGVFRSRALRLAVMAAVRGRTGARVALLEESDPDLAVALGAARYGVAREVGATRIEAGAPRSYYVGVASATPGRAPRAVCIVPRGTLEGVRCEAKAVALKLRTGELARFDLYRARTGVKHDVGAIVEADEKSFARLRQLVTRVEGAAAQIDVRLAGELSPVGTLDLALHEANGRDRTFALAFQVRAPANAAPSPALLGERRSDLALESAPSTRAPALREAEALVSAAFTFPNKDGRAARELVQALEKLLGDRLSWPLVDARHLYDALFERRAARRWSPEHERVFWSLGGACLRPGFGAPGDERRVAELFSLFAQRATFADRPPVAQAFYVAWRRVAPGLDALAQTALFDALFPLLAGSPRKVVAEAELRELLAWLERIDLARKTALAERLLASPQAASTLVELSRIAARVPVYGDVRGVVPPAAAQAWLARVSDVDPSRHRAAQALVRLARVTADPARDFPPRARRALATQLCHAGASVDVFRPLEAHVEISSAERGTSFGDALPPGLALAT